jgi:hypothetical protein
MCQPLWWDGSEQMPELLRVASDHMFDTRAWRGPAVVGGDGIEPPTSTELAEHDPSLEDFWFAKADTPGQDGTLKKLQTGSARFSISPRRPVAKC